MSSRVVTIVLDGVSMAPFERWLESGALPTIAALCDNGNLQWHCHTKRFRNERCWDIFLSGEDKETIGSTFEPWSYGYYNHSLQRETAYLPFYALGNDYKVCAFDLPATLTEATNGIQVVGWGSELNVAFSASRPPELINEIHARYGKDPKLTQSFTVIDTQTQEPESSYIIPSLYDYDAVLAFKDKLLASVKTRQAIAVDLLQRDNWDLFLVNFPELHTANHVLWHLSEKHLLAKQIDNTQPILAIAQAIDGAIAQIVQACGSGAKVVLTTLDNTVVNSMDVPSMAMLPELMYRYSHPGNALLTPAQAGLPVPPVHDNYSELWKHEIWKLVSIEGQQRLLSPTDLQTAGDPMSWHPAVWYQPEWPLMKAFALPSVSDGYIRVNVANRERQGWLEPGDFHKVLTELEDLLLALTNARTGEPLVAKVIRVRQSPFEKPEIPPDLIVSWASDSPADCVDHPTLGRVGPLPFFRSGGHVPHGSNVKGLFVTHPSSDVLATNNTRPLALQDVSRAILSLVRNDKQG